MESSTEPRTNPLPVGSVKRINRLIAMAILLGFLAAAITYRTIALEEIQQSRTVLVGYEELAAGRDYSSLITDSRILNRIAAQSLHEVGRLPSRVEVEARVEELAQAGELAHELDDQRVRFSFFTDLIIYGLAVTIMVFLAVLLYKQRHSYMH